MIDLREVECFLTLCDELHFGHTAERLFVSQPRVSQAIRSLEQQIGAPLFERTSRRVRLTPLGRQLHGSLAPAYQDLCGAVRDAAAAARGVDGTLRVGFLGSAANEYTTEIIDVFRDRYPACALTMTEVHFADPLGRLRAEEVDVLITRLPVEEADLTVGPTVVLEPRVLAVATAHVLAGRESVSLEDVADHPVFAVAGRAPAYWWDFHVPPVTPAGRPLHRLMSVSTVQELLALVAAGPGVAPMVASVPRYYGRPDLAFVPIRDMPPSAVALVWRTAGGTARVTAFAAAAAHVVDRNGGPAGGTDQPARGG